MSTESERPLGLGLSEGLGPTRDAALRELDDATNQNWRGKRARWAALVRAQDAEIERLREHAVILAETAREVERERCAQICDEARAAVWPLHDAEVFKAAQTVCENLANRIRGLGA